MPVSSRHGCPWARQIPYTPPFLGSHPLEPHSLGTPFPLGPLQGRGSPRKLGLPLWGPLTDWSLLWWGPGEVRQEPHRCSGTPPNPAFLGESATGQSAHGRGRLLGAGCARELRTPSKGRTPDCGPRLLSWPPLPERPRAALPPVSALSSSLPPPLLSPSLSSIPLPFGTVSPSVSLCLFLSLSGLRLSLTAALWL